MVKEKGEKSAKTNLYLLAIVAIVAVVGIVVLVLNAGNGSISYSSDDLSGQAIKANLGKTTLDLKGMSSTDAAAAVLSATDGDCCQECKRTSDGHINCYCTC